MIVAFEMLGLEIQHKKRATLGLPFTGTGRRILALSATAVLRILVPLRGAGFRASYPNSYPLSLISLCPCFSLQSMPGCIQCVVLFPVILDEITIPTGHMETCELCTLVRRVCLLWWCRTIRIIRLGDYRVRLVTVAYTKLRQDLTGLCEISHTDSGESLKSLLPALRVPGHGSSPISIPAPSATKSVREKSL
ncbi:hypothetical protein SAMN04488490_3487 [Marinobacter sp. LV10R510-11A]|nr:hypothetical protein SAMN04488490_3487 [Marinobacter sp. LV10R510-11A]